jgi:hypothetical protein
MSDPWAHPASYPMDTEGPFYGSKASGAQSWPDNSHPSSGEVKIREAIPTEAGLWYDAAENDDNCRQRWVCRQVRYWNQGWNLAVPYLKRLDAGFPPRRPGKHVEFAVDNAALGQVFSEYFGFPCQSFHQFLHFHNHLRLAQKVY